MPRHQLTLRTNVTGPGRTEDVMGTTYRVVPATLVRSQVLHNNLGRCLLPAEAITEEWAEAANGAPVVADHPTRFGQHVSAREPEVLNALGTGYLYHARVENGDLKADVYLNEERAEAVADLATILGALDAGEPVELSTGFPVAVEPKTGVFNGRRYDMVVQPLGFDHLAVLADAEGACSLKDGCGLGVNCHVEDCADEPVAPGAEDSADSPEGFARSLLQVLKRLVGNQEELSLDDIRGLVRDAAEERWGDSDTFVWVVELFMDDAIIEVDPQDGAGALFRVPYSIDETERAADLGEAVEVERITEFVPVANGRIEARHEYLERNPTPEEGEMKRAELINTLAECEDVKFGRKALDAMTDDELAQVANDAEVDLGAEEADDPEPEPTPEATPAEGADADNATPAWAKSLVETVNRFGERLDQLEADVEPTRNEQAEEKSRLVTEVAANSDFEESELEDKPLAELRKLHAAAVRKPANYLGLGGPRPSQPSKEPDLPFTVHSTLGAGPGEPLESPKEN